MTDDQQAVPVPALAYQPPAEAAGNPWVAIARVIGWAAAALACARLGGAAASALFLWSLRQQQGVSIGEVQLVLGFGEALLHVPILIGGLGCARPRPSTWKLLTYGLFGLIVLKALFLLVGLATSLTASSTSFGTVGRIGLAGQSIFHTLEDAVPLALMLWLLRRRMIRDVFENPSGQL